MKSLKISLLSLAVAVIAIVGMSFKSKKGTTIEYDYKTTSTLVPVSNPGSNDLARINAASGAVLVNWDVPATQISGGFSNLGTVIITVNSYTGTFPTDVELMTAFRNHFSVNYASYTDGVQFNGLTIPAGGVGQTANVDMQTYLQ